MHMDFTDFAAAIALGNIGTLSFLWGCVQFHRHDYKAPWLAYAAFLFPLFFILASVIATEGLPPHFDALGLQSFAAPNH